MNHYNPNIHHRRSIRLKGYDYSQAGLYFITICTQNRAHLFGEIRNGEMILNDAGKMVEAEWLNLKNRFPNIELHEFVVMQDHFHGILEITTVAATPIRATPVRATPIGATLVVAQNDKGQPQGIAPTSTSTLTLTSTSQNDKGQPQGIAPTSTSTLTLTSTSQNDKGQPQGIAPTIGTMIDAFKSIVTVNYIRGVKQNNWTPFDGKLWQRNYYEHIIRNDGSYIRISEYIINNPAKWSVNHHKE